MMNIQQSNGDFSPNINGNNNRTNNFKVGFACKARYTFLGFILGIATSYLRSCLPALLSMVYGRAYDAEYHVRDLRAKRT